MKLRVLPLALSLIAVGVARAAFNPIPLTPDSFNQDVVVETNATPRLVVVTTASVDQGTNNGANTWMEIGFDPANPTYGLPAPGAVVVAEFNANYSFQMPPSYTAPNGILINATQVTNGIWTLVAPAPYALLSFAGSGGNGGDVIGVKVRHQDGSIEVSAFPCPDWFNGTSNVIMRANERCGSTVNFTYANIASDNPRLYARDMVLTNTTSAVTNIELFYVSGPVGSHNDVLAVSGATTLGGPVTPIAVTGYTYDFIVEASAAKRGLTMAANGIDRATSQSMDNVANTGNSWYEIGFNFNNPDGGGVPIPDATMRTTSGIPAAGSLVTNAAGDHIYQMPASYASSNALWLGAGAATTGTITPVSPISVVPTAPATSAALSFLAAAGNGPVTPEVVLNFQDGTSQTSNIVVPDWFNTTAPFVYGANGRIAVDTAQFNSITRTANRTPRLFNCDLIVGNTTSAITNIFVNYTNTGGRISIFAVSGTAEPIKPVFTASPASTAVNPGANVQLAATAIANAPVTYRWQKGTNGVYVDLSDGGNISGATTATLSVNNVGDADDADYRVVATDNAGSANSGISVLTVISALPDVTQAGDPIVAYQPNGGSSPAAETVDHAIDNFTQKYLNNGNGATPMSIPVGFIVTPSMGRTRVTGMRLYTANDVPERDPANVILEGSDDGGNTWSLIYSNVVVMPDGRNAGGTIPIDPLTQTIRQIRFANANGYTRYRWYTTRVKGAAPLMQIGEVELLGVADTSGLPSVNLPAEVKAFEGSNAVINAAVTGTPAPTLRWQKQVGGVFSNLNDGGNVSGATTAMLTLNPASNSDAGSYRLIASNTSGSRTSSVVSLVILSSLTDVTQPGDPILATGGEGSTIGNGTPESAIDNTVSPAWQTGGHGINASAGFAPFGGPVTLSITPAAGGTIVTGLRIYNALDAPERDPADYKLEGSNDGGTNYSLISQGALALSTARADNAQPFDPLIQPLQEIRFANNRPFTSYLITFTHTRDDNAANSLQISELELLGVVAPPNPILTISTGGGGTLTITSSANGTLQSRTNVATGTWVTEGPITGGTPVVITPSPTDPPKFFRVQVP